MTAFLCYVLRVMPSDLLLDGRLSDGTLPSELLGLTERERRFACAYFDLAVERGTDAGVAGPAYRRAFPLSAADESSHSSLGNQILRLPRVVFLVSLLRERLSYRATVPTGKVVSEVERIAFSNILDYIRIDDAGQASVDLTRITPGTAAAITELETTERELPNGVVIRRTKIKLAGKMDALDKLIRIHGLYQDKLSVNFSQEDLDRAIVDMENKLQQRRLEAPVVEHTAD